ncbi:MAG: pantothenate kinase [Rhodospirillaceae bacterium]|nr:pantothenate kinase [Rhodospirillaceae bacterium]
MLLAIDIGNTNIVLACAHAADLAKDRPGRPQTWRIETNIGEDAVAFAEAMRTALGDDSCQAISAAMIASVVPAVTTGVKEGVRIVADVVPLVVGDPNVDLGIRVNIDQPSQAGADRLVNAVGAQVHHSLPAIILDFGTATTLDLVAEDGTYEGGIIAPGVALSIDALDAAAAQLSRLVLRPFDSDLPILGKNTVAAMESGIFWGYVSMIDGLLARLRARYGDVSLVATGGLAELFAQHLSSKPTVDADLTVKGLFEIYARNSIAAGGARNG